MRLTRTLAALIADAPEDSLAAVAQSGVEVLLGKKLMIYDDMDLLIINKHTEISR